MLQSTYLSIRSQNLEVFRIVGSKSGAAQWFINDPLQYFGTDYSGIVPTIFQTNFHTPNIFTRLKMDINQNGPLLTQSVGLFVTHFEISQ